MMKLRTIFKVLMLMAFFTSLLHPHHTSAQTSDAQQHIHTLAFIIGSPTNQYHISEQLGMIAA